MFQVTQDPSAVLPLEYGDMCGLNGVELQTLFCSMAKQIQNLLSQRDTHLEVRENNYEINYEIIIENVFGLVWLAS